MKAIHYELFDMRFKHHKRVFLIRDFWKAKFEALISTDIFEVVKKLLETGVA